MALPIIPRGDEVTREKFEAFGCKVSKGSPPTPDRRDPDVVVDIEFFGSLDIPLPDGKKLRIWGFKRPGTRDTFPSVPIRVLQGQNVHVPLKSSKHTHTIHFHGIEPTTFNDGVGHTSFDVGTRYTYQWRPRFPGFHLYHCHVNTVLHFEMGMYGALIVDPPEGKGFIRRQGETLRYDVEHELIGDEADPRWHKLDHHAGINCPWGPDVGLNKFVPKYFFLNGVPSTGKASSPTRTSAKTVLRARVGQTVVLRLLNAGYTIQQYILGLPAEVIEVDGRTLGDPVHSPYSRPIPRQANTPLEFTTAQRAVLLLRPRTAGTFPVKVLFLHWITRQLLHTAETLIHVSAP